MNSAVFLLNEKNDPILKCCND